MKFRTEIEIAPFARPIGHDDRILALGSCFASEIGDRLAEAKFRIVVNPSGVLFNPLSICRALQLYESPRTVTEQDLHYSGGRWFHYDFHGSLSGTTVGETLRRINAAAERGAQALHAATVAIVTLGTAWVYERCDTGEVVANCHRQPAATFRRRRLTVGETVDALEKALDGPLRNRHTILTVSPVRHLGDGLTGNAVSKAVLRLAAQELVERHPERITYFPAFEMLCDDLRDYRFYADDLVHPSPQAVTYIWERLRDTLLSPDARALLPRIAEVTAAARHHPLLPESEAYRTLCRRQLDAIERLPQIDFTEERAFFLRHLEINS